MEPQETSSSAKQAIDVAVYNEWQRMVAVDVPAEEATSKRTRRHPLEGGWRGVLVAAHLYAVVFALLYGLLILLLLGGPSFQTPLPHFLAGEESFSRWTFLASLLGGVFFLMVVLFAFYAAVSLLISFVFQITDLACKSLGGRPSATVFASFVGGLLGFLCTFPLVLEFFVSPQASQNGFFLTLLIGPILATLMGQIGGAWGAVFYEPTLYPASRRFQFSLYQLLILTLGISLALALLRLTGLLASPLLVYGIAWGVCQAISLWMIVALARWLVTLVREGKK